MKLSIENDWKIVTGRTLVKIIETHYWVTKILVLSIKIMMADHSTGRFTDNDKNTAPGV